MCYGECVCACVREQLSSVHRLPDAHTSVCVSVSMCAQERVCELCVCVCVYGVTYSEPQRLCTQTCRPICSARLMLFVLNETDLLKYEIHLPIDTDCYCI